MKTAALTVALILGLSPRGASAADPTPEEQVQSFLGAIDRVVPPESFTRLGPRAEAELARVAQSPSELPTRRAMALEGLAAFGTARAQQLHRQLAADPKAPPTVRSSAVSGLGRLVPAAQLTAELRPFLERDPSPVIRAYAANALAHQAPAQACAAVRAQAAREATPPPLMTRAAQACAGR